MNTIGLSPPTNSFPTDRFKPGFLLRFFFVRLWFHKWRLCYLFLISHSSRALGGLGFMIVAFPEYFHLYFWKSDSQMYVFRNFCKYDVVHFKRMMCNWIEFPRDQKRSCFCLLIKINQPWGCPFVFNFQVYSQGTYNNNVQAGFFSKKADGRNYIMYIIIK